MLNNLVFGPIRAMTSRYPRLGIIARAAKEVLNGPPLPTIDWIIGPVRLQRSPHEKVRLNGLVGSLNPAKGYAGNMMVAELFEGLAPHFDSARLIVFDETNPTEASRFPGFRLVPPGEDSDEPRQVISIRDKTSPLPVGPNDIFLSSLFSHSYMIINHIIPWQSREFGRAPNPMVYLIQDYEPGFWPWSSEYLLAESTYHAPNPLVAVFNSSLLRDYFRERNYAFSREYKFEPKLNSVLRQPF